MDRNVLLATFISFIFVFIYLSFYMPQGNDINQINKNQSNKNLLTQEPEKNIQKESIDPFSFSEEEKNETKEDISSNFYEKEFKENPSLKVLPKEDYFFNDKNKLQKYKEFTVETKRFLLEMTTQNAGILNWKFKDYLDEKNNSFLEAIFEKDLNYPALGTYFQSRMDILENQLKDYQYKHYYDYKVYAFSENAFKLKQSSRTDDNDLSLKELEKAYKIWLNKYPKDSSQGSFKVILFYADFYIHDTKRQFRLYKFLFLREDKNIIDFFLLLKNQSDIDIHLEGNSQSKKSIYTYWGPSLGPRNDEDNSIYNTIQLSYLNIPQHSAEAEENLLDRSQENISNFKWLSLDSRYLSFFMIPSWNIENNKKVWNKENDAIGNIYLGKQKEKKFLFDLWTSYEKLDKNKEYIELAHPYFFLKAKDEKILEYTSFLAAKTRFALNDRLYQDFDFTVIKNRSWIPLIKPIEWFIEYFIFYSYQLVKNYGLSIILLAIFLKIIFYPLTKRSTVSMQKMQKLSPRIKQINQTYKNNSQKKQEALFKLYKEEKVNPFSGCLPILIQIPVFYALWTVLPSLLELKNVNFLWIHDLSSPDTVMKLKFGFLNMNLNILPILMTATSVLQIFLTPKNNLSLSGDQAAESQKTMQMMQYFLPILFLFLFWSMPAGLVLYWTVQNFLQILNQIYVNVKG